MTHVLASATSLSWWWLWHIAQAHENARRKPDDLAGETR